MELTVLGRCGPFPRGGEACSGYLITSGDTRLLLDMGPGTLSRYREKHSLREITAVALSHLHFDHFADLLVLQYGLGALKKYGTPAGMLPVYLPAAPEPHRALLDESVLTLRTVSPGLAARIGELTVRFFPVRHPVETYGMEIAGPEGKRLVFTGDTGYFPELAREAAGADALLADTAFLAEENTGKPMPHMTCAQACLLAREAGVKRLLCTHVSGLLEDEEKLRKEIDFAPGGVVQERGHYCI